MVDKTYDCIIIGAGPAGTTAASVLADKGRRVLVLEKEIFPRYHIGESLIPYCHFPLARIGMVDKLNATAFPKKYSVQFVSRDGRQSQPFYFNQHLDHAAAQTWQVTRADFDHMLMEHAREKGAEIREQVQVKSLIKDGERVVGVSAEDARGTLHEFRAPVTIDASGRSALSMARSNWRVPDAFLKKISIWTYYVGAKRDPGIDEGATTVAYVEGKNWFWYIPLKDNRVSVGVVGERDYLYQDTRDPGKIFQREAAKNAWIQDHLAPGCPTGEYWVTSDFSYRSEYCATDGLVLTGDAFAFLDPVFSSGVFLALKGGELAGDAVEKALAENDVSARQFADYGRTMSHGLEAMRKLVYTFYDENFSYSTVLKKYPHLKGDLTDCLIGHVDRDFSELFNAVAEFARVPEPLPHGGVKA